MQEDNEFKPIQIKKKSRAKGVVFSLLFILLIAACGALGWLVYTGSQTLDSQKNDLQALSARVEALETDNKDTKTKLDAALKADTTAMSDEESIKAASLEFLEDPTGENNTITISKQEGDFVKAQYVTEAGPGGFVILKIINGEWTVLLSGNGETAENEAIVKEYDIPTTILQ